MDSLFILDVRRRVCTMSLYACSAASSELVANSAFCIPACVKKRKAFFSSKTFGFSSLLRTVFWKSSDKAESYLGLASGTVRKSSTTVPLPLPSSAVFTSYSRIFMVPTLPCTMSWAIRALKVTRICRIVLSISLKLLILASGRSRSMYKCI